MKILFIIQLRNVNFKSAYLANGLADLEIQIHKKTNIDIKDIERIEIIQNFEGGDE